MPKTRGLLINKLVPCVILVLTLSGNALADDKNKRDSSTKRKETLAEVTASSLHIPLDLYGDLATDLDIDIDDLQTPETNSQEEQQQIATGGHLDPGFSNFGRAIGYNFTKGLFAKDNLKPFVIGSLATLAMIPVDEEVSDYFQGKSEELGDAGQFIGALGVAATTGGVLLATPFVKNEKYRAFSFSLTQSMILNNALVFSLKYAVGRTRPNEESNVSFPSGHTSNTVALAAVVDHYYGKKWGVPLYIVAGLVGLARIEKGKHFPSDVVFGATLGYIAARSAIRGTEHYASKRKWTLLPSVGRRHAAVYFYLEF